MAGIVTVLADVTTHARREQAISMISERVALLHRPLPFADNSSTLSTKRFATRVLLNEKSAVSTARLAFKGIPDS